MSPASQEQALERRLLFCQEALFFGCEFGTILICPRGAHRVSIASAHYEKLSSSCLWICCALVRIGIHKSRRKSAETDERPEDRFCRIGVRFWQGEIG